MPASSEKTQSERVGGAEQGDGSGLDTGLQAGRGPPGRQHAVRTGGHRGRMRPFRADHRRHVVG